MEDRDLDSSGGSRNWARGVQSGCERREWLKILGPRPLPVGVSFKIGHRATFVLLQKFVFYMIFIIGTKIFNSVSDQHKRKGHSSGM